MLSAVFLMGAVFVLNGCASILGVEEATCDPAVDDRCRGGSDTSEGGAAGQADAGSSGQTAGGQGDAGEVDTAPPTKEEACEEYCSDVTQACTDFPQYPNENGCRVVCNNMLPLAGENGGVLEDTLECRATVAKIALDFEEDPEGNCQAAGPMGVGCGDVCEKYCAYMQRFCIEQFELMADDCVEQCREVPRKPSYVHTDVYDNTLECRFIHIQLSIVDSPIRETHCLHAAGNEPCK